VESIESGLPVEQATSTPISIIKNEGETQRGAFNTRQTTIRKRTKIKKEDDEEMREELDQMAVDERLDLAELNVPGGPISSRRKTSRVRGWKKIELWIEEEDRQEIVLDEDGIPNPEGSGREQVSVKIEDDAMGEVMFSVPQPIMLESSDESRAEKMRRAQKSRARKLKTLLKGKTREDKEELAREEVDLEVLRDQLLNQHEPEVW
jgi:hypothetical protein